MITMDTFVDLIFRWVMISACLTSVQATSSSPAVLLTSDHVPMNQIPLRLWSNPRKSSLKPRGRDLHLPALLTLMGDDMNHAWMSYSRTKPSEKGRSPDERRWSGWLAKEAEIATSEIDNEQVRSVMTSWLVEKATCLVEYTWKDLGPDFWPRWVRVATCPHGQSTCSWPSGMACSPGPALHLNLLRWHCRLRKNRKKKKLENNIWLNTKPEDKKKKKKQKYKCIWVKVPYPVPQDCICSCRANYDEHEHSAFEF